VHKLAIDASTAAQWQLSEEPEAERARHMLRDYATERVAFVAPTIWHYEVANIVNKAVGTRRLTEEEGSMAFQALQALAIDFVNFPTPAEAYRLARLYRRSVYDSLYLAVAQSHQVDLWTGDRRLYNAVRQSLPFVKWSGDYVSPERQGTG
jgi:predicted nucleic acid-binding protein